MLIGSAGLWTHYSFPILLGAAGAAYLYHWASHPAAPHRFGPLGRFLLLNALIAISYLPRCPRPSVAGCSTGLKAAQPPPL
ncbi:MAG: hypothetical protein R2911_04290 [Caldilineaceae bacterium]